MATTLNSQKLLTHHIQIVEHLMSDGLARVLFATVFFVLGDYIGVQGAIDFGKKILNYLQQFA